MCYGKIIVLACIAVISACQAASAPSTKTDQSVPSKKVNAEKATPSTNATNQKTPSHLDGAMNELNVFVEGNAKILAGQLGDLRGQGVQDVVLILDHPGTGEEKLGEGAPRSVLILVRDAAGKLQKAKENDRLVPCAQCGGLAGDPFGYVRADKGGFTVLTEGGSRERWSDEYTFKYTAEQQDWLLDKAVRGVIDTETGDEKHIELTQKDFGAVRFEVFDPATLRKVDGE